MSVALTPKGSQEPFLLPSWLNKAAWLVTALLLSVYVWQVLSLVDNSPKGDDLNDIFGFFQRLQQAQNIHQKIFSFFYPNNEHITLFNHLVYYSEYRLLGEIRIEPLILIGHIIVISTGALLAFAIWQNEHLPVTVRPTAAAAAMLGYVNLHYWGSSFMAMTALSNQAVLLFSLATLMALHHSKYFLLAIPLAFLASFSQGNGILVWPLGAAMIFIDRQRPFRQRQLFIWVIAAVITACIYQKALHDFSEPSSITLELILQAWLQHPLAPLLAPMAFLGSTFFSTDGIMLALLTGAVASVIVLRSAREIHGKHGLLIWMAFYIMASAFMASIARALFYGDPVVMLESRYRMYSFAMVIISMTLMVSRLSSRDRRITAIAVFILISCAFHLTGYKRLKDINEQRTAFDESYHHWLTDGDLRNASLYMPDADHFLFIAHYLQVFDPATMRPTSEILKLHDDSDSLCTPPTTQEKNCTITASHQSNALAVAVSVNTTYQDTGKLAICQHNRLLGATPLTTLQSRYLIREEEIPPGHYQVFLYGTLGHCQTTLDKKERPVLTEMHQLFDGT